MSGKEYSVSEAVRLIGVESHVLRYWEDELQVEISRTSQGHRIYSENDIRMFRKVKELKEHGLQLKAIRILLDESEGDMEKSAIAEQICGIGNRQEASAESEPERAEKASAESEPERAEKASAENQPEGPEKTVPAGRQTLCEIALTEGADQTTDYMQEFESILKNLIGEVVEEQNLKLEQTLREILREEINRIYVSYEEVMQEAAAAACQEREPDREKNEKTGILGYLRGFLRRS